MVSTRAIASGSQRSIASFFGGSSTTTGAVKKKAGVTAMSTLASSSNAATTLPSPQSPVVINKAKRSLSTAADAASSSSETYEKSASTTTDSTSAKRTKTESNKGKTKAKAKSKAKTAVIAEPDDIEVKTLPSAGSATEDSIAVAAAAAAVAQPPTKKGWLRGLLTDEHWCTALDKEMNKAYFRKLETYIDTRTNKGKTIYPPRSDIFTALNLCPLPDIKVVILGQDPYHGPDQAHGLAFSVQHDIKVPPSLRNIYKEAKSDVGLEVPTHGNLSLWAEQGVLMLNTVLTVEKAQPNSHKKQGWESFTDEVVRVLNKSEEPLVFLLWGKPAHTKGVNVNKSKHLVISSSHPSPLGATKTASPFIGSRCFSRVNEFLKKNGKEPIDWQV